MSYELLYWEKAVINQPENGQRVVAVMKGGDIQSFHYLTVNIDWFIRNVSEWLATTSFTYEQASKAMDFVSDCYHNYDCEQDAHRYKNSNCRVCNARKILEL